MDYFFRNGEGDEVYFVHEGSGTLHTTFGDLPYKEATTSSSRAGRRTPSSRQARSATCSSRRPLIEIPKRYRNQYGQLMEHAPFYHRDIHPPTELQTVRERGEFRLKIRVRDGYQDYEIDYHPFDVVGWDGYLYPWTFNINDFEPITGASTCRRRRIRPSPARTSSSARSVRESWTSTRWRSRSRTTTRISRARR